jgi:hypothetical protein
MQAIDAHLKNARWDPTFPDRLIGEIYADAKGRFADGVTVTTSPATDIGQGMFRTRSGTVYQVAFKETASHSVLLRLKGLIDSCEDYDNDEAELLLLEADAPVANTMIVRQNGKRYRVSLSELKS